MLQYGEIIKVLFIGFKFKLIKERCVYVCKINRLLKRIKMMIHERLLFQRKL